VPTAGAGGLGGRRSVGVAPVDRGHAGRRHS
jgi:hypothetical protein